MEVLDDFVKDLFVGAAGDKAHRAHGFDDALGIVGQRPLNQIDDAAPHLGGDLGHGAEVEKHQAHVTAFAFAPAHQQIAGVRIRVVDAIFENLLAIGLDHQLGQAPAVKAGPAEPGQVGDLDAPLEVSGQDSRRRQLVDDGGKGDVRTLGEVVGDAGGVGCLAAKIELLAQKSLDFPVDVVQPVVGGKQTDNAENAPQRL